MKKIRFIFFLLFISLATFPVDGNEGVEIFSPVEELAEDVESRVSPLLKDVEDDSAYLKNNRRGNNNNDHSFGQKSAFQFTQKELQELEKKRKASYGRSFGLWDHEETSFLHRFQLF